MQLQDVRPRRSARTAGILSCAAVLLLAACSSTTTDGTDAAGDGSATVASGPWAFVDDRPVRSELDAVPQRIVAYESAAAALMGFGLDSSRIVGIFGSQPLEENSFLEGFDTSAIEDVGSVYGEVEFEAIVGLQPDVIVTTAFIDERTGADAEATQLGGVQGPEARNQLMSIAPVVAIDEQLPGSQFIERFGELAETLGVDHDSPEVAASRNRFEQAVEAFRAACAETEGVLAMGVFGEPASLYVVQPRDWPDLPELEQWGMALVHPESDAQYFEILSWEEYDRYPADIILYDARGWAPDPERYTEFFPSWATLPAVKAGQTFEWKNYEAVTTYDKYAEMIEGLTQVIATSKDIV
jgi:iron complex transport system substrate-binding protein